MNMKYLKSFIIIMGMSLFTSCLKQESGNPIPGVQGPYVNIQDGKIILTMILEKVDTSVGFSTPLPKIDSSMVTIGPAINGDGSQSGTLLRASFDLKELDSDKFKIVPAQKLPDGRDFPFLIDGTLPALAFNLPTVKNTTFYASKKVFGLFLPLTLPKELDFNLAYRIKVNGKKYGLISLIAPNEIDEGSGVVVLLTLDDIRNNPSVLKLLNRSKNNKKRLY